MCEKTERGRVSQCMIEKEKGKTNGRMESREREKENYYFFRGRNMLGALECLETGPVMA